MADITQDSYNEALRFFKVIFQRGRDCRDSELNEFQDILRFLFIRSIANGVQRTKLNTLNPGSNDDGYLVVGTGAANSVTLKAGTLFCDGLAIALTADTAFSGFTTAGAPRTDTVYLAITEAEIADPSANAQLGETTRRRQVQVTVAVSITGPAGVPANTVSEIFAGGTHYFPIANIARATGVAAIAAIDVTDTRALLPPQYVEDVQLNTAGKGDVIVGGVAKPVSFVNAPHLLAAGTVFSQVALLLGLINAEYRTRTIGVNKVVDDDGYRDKEIIFSAAGITLTLPAPASNFGRELWLVDKTGTLNPTTPTAVTLVRNAGGDKIDHVAADYSLIIPYGRWRLSCDGTDWYLFSC